MIFTSFCVFTVLAVMALPGACWKNYPCPFVVDHWKRNKLVGYVSGRGFS